MRVSTYFRARAHVVRRGVHVVASLVPEQPAVRCHTEAFDVCAEDTHELRRDGHRPGRGSRAALERVHLMHRAVIRPLLACSDDTARQVEHAPPGLGQIALLQPEVNDLRRPHRRVVHTTEERLHDVEAARAFSSPTGTARGPESTQFRPELSVRAWTASMMASSLITTSMPRERTQQPGPPPARRRRAASRAPRCRGPASPRDSACGGPLGLLGERLVEDLPRPLPGLPEAGPLRFS